MIFISYRRKDSAQVDALAKAMRAEGVDYWLDRNDIDDSASIQHRIEEGLAKSHALLAWYSLDYPRSRACQWELTAALLAASADDSAAIHSSKRLLVVNPEATPEHIQPLQLVDVQNFPHQGDDYTALARRIKAAVADIPTTLGELRRLAKPEWHGLHGLGSPRFVGRVREMWDIHASLTAGQFAIVAGLPGPRTAGELAQLRGSGGIGKSQLAEEYAMRFGAGWPGGIFWLRAYGISDNPAETEAELAERREAAYGSQLAGFAMNLGLDTRDKIDAELRADIGRRLTQPYLWIVDDLPRCGRDELERWLAPSGAGRTLVTTRNKRLDGAGRAIDLDTLPPEEARALLTRDHPPAADEEADVTAILKYLDGYALALDVARAACRDFGYTAFRRRLDNPDADALALDAELAPELPNGHNPHIAVTLLSSLKQLGDAGLDALRLAAHAAAAPIPADLLGATLIKVDGLTEDTAAERAALGLRQVLNTSLADPADVRQYTVHNLVLHTLRRHDPDAARCAALRAPLMQVLNEALADGAGDIRRHGRLEALMPHAQALAAQATDGLLGLDIAGWLGRYDLEAGRYRAATSWYVLERQGRTEVLGEEHPATLTSMGNLASTLWNKGDLAGARALQEKVLEVRRRVLGEEHPATLTSMNNLANTLGGQGDLAGACALQEKVLEVSRRVLGEGHPDTLTSMNNLASTLQAQGDLAAALALEEKALEVSYRVLGEEHPDTLRSMNNLAGTLQAQGDLAGARALEEKALEVRRRVQGEEHPATLTSMNNLTSTLQAQGDLAGARALQEKVLELRRRVLGEEHPDTLTSMNNLALTLWDQGDLAGARALEEKVLEVRRRVQGEGHPDTLSSMNNLASTLQAQGDLASARALQEKVLEVRRRVLGEEHPDTLTSMNNLALTLWDQGDLAGARALEEKVLEVIRRVLGEEHPNTLSSMNNLAGTLWNQGDLAGARALQEKVLEVRRRVQGEEHPDTLTSMNNLASTLRNQGDLAGTRALEEKVLEVRRRVQGEEHPDVTGSAWNLFYTVLNMQEMQRAAQIFEQHLHWLIDSQPDSLSMDQRQIREQLIALIDTDETGTVVASLAVDPRPLYVPTGVHVQAGERYAFSASGKWRDWFKVVGPEGWGGGLLTRFNRVRGRPFFLLCGTVGQDDRLAFGIGAELSEWRVPESVAGLDDRQLYLFANDWRTMYCNNHALNERDGGPMQVTIFRLA